MQADPRYRTPIPTLRRCAGSDIELRLYTVPECEPAVLSDAVTDWIGRRFQGNRTAAERTATQIVIRALGVADFNRWPDSERRAFREIALLFAQIADLGRWPQAAKRATVALMRAKGRDEFRFHAIIARHRLLRAALTRLAKP